MVFAEITRHAGIVETAVLPRQAIIDYPLFMQIPIGDRDNKTSGKNCQEQESPSGLLFQVFHTAAASVRDRLLPYRVQDGAIDRIHCPVASDHGGRVRLAYTVR